MLNQQVLFLSVFKKNETLCDHEYHWLYPTPKFALRVVTTSIRNRIEQLRSFITEQHLVSIACSDPEVSWFESVEQKSVFHAHAVLHVSLDKIWFSGRIAPHENDYFETQTISLCDILDDEKSTKSMDAHQFISPIALPLIREIEKKAAESEALIERYYALDDLSDALDKMSSIETDCLNTNVDDMSHEMAQQIDKLKSDAERAEESVAILCNKLLNVVFGVSVGDRIDYLPPDTDKPTSLFVKQAIFTDGCILVSGPKILKSGKMGKRDEIISIPIQATQ